MIFNMSGGSENLTEQMTQLETVVTEIEESLLGKGSGANITPQTVLKGYTGYKNKNLVTGEYDVSNLVPANVREGMTFGAGLVGTMSEGVSGIDYGEVTLTSNGRPTIYHNLKTTPQLAVLLPLNLLSYPSVPFLAYTNETSFYNTLKSTFVNYNSGASNYDLACEMTDESVTFGVSSTGTNLTQIMAGTYLWIVKA